MHLSFTAAILAVAGSAIALPQNPAPAKGGALPSGVALPPALPASDFKTPKFARPLTLDEALAGVNATVTTIVENIQDAKNKLPELQLPPKLLPVTTRDLDEELEKFEKRQSTCSNPAFVASGTPTPTPIVRRMSMPSSASRPARPLVSSASLPPDMRISSLCTRP